MSSVIASYASATEGLFSFLNLFSYVILYRRLHNSSRFHFLRGLYVFITTSFSFLPTEPITKFDARYDRKFVSSAFFRHEVEEEFRERNINWCFKGYDWENLDDALNAINDIRKGELYQHDEANCSTLCQEKGKLLFVCWFSDIVTFCFLLLSRIGFCEAVVCISKSNYSRYAVNSIPSLEIFSSSAK